MKISQHSDLSKALEIGTTESDDSFIDLQGDTTVTTKHRDSGEKSTVAVIDQHGGVEFVQRPSVDGHGVVTFGDDPFNKTPNQVSFADNVTGFQVPISPMGTMVGIFYSIKNATSDEYGNITILHGDNGYNLDIVSHYVNGMGSEVSFDVLELNGSIVLELNGSGDGIITDFKYFVNTLLA